MGWDAPWHWVVVAILVIALFGYKKLPDAARSLGRSLRIFKTEIKGMTEDDKARDAARDAAAATPSQPAVTAVNPIATEPPPPATIVVPAQAQAPVVTPANNGDKRTESSE